MVYTQRSERCEGNLMEVQILSPALKNFYHEN